ncbi:MAG: hypothetical protein WC789_06195 [Lentisphaeria bacterium]|jgi:hypothetical protein
MSEKPPNPSPCPDLESLSAWFDGEEEQEVAAGHVEACPECNRKVDAYGVIRKGVRQGLAPANDLIHRIKAACGREHASRLSRGWAPHPFSPLRLAWAAGLVLVAGGLSLLLSRPPRGAQALPVAAGAAALPSAMPVNVVTPAAPKPAALAAAPAGDSGVARPVAAGDLRLVSLGAPPAAAAAVPQPLPARIRHVWVVGDLAAARGIVGRTLPGQPLASTRNGSLRGEVELRDADVVRLVEALQAAGFSLVSPQAPQPGAGQQVAVQGRPVAYAFELVPAAGK